VSFRNTRIEEKILKRSTYDMSIDVLEIIEKINVPSKIMFAANMSWRRFMMIIAGLKAVGLVEEKVFSGVNKLLGPGRRSSDTFVEGVPWRTNIRTQRRYSLTEKGRKVLSLVKNLNKMTEGLGNETEALII
jgi:predicted transcriptional regulator